MANNNMANNNMAHKNRSAILLVGGRGTRLAPLTNNTPKPMLQVPVFHLPSIKLLRRERLE